MTYEFPRKVRDLILTRDLNRCVRCGRYLPEGAHLHHRKLRSQGGEGLPENGITMCTVCHSWAHGHVAAANATGLIVPGWADPEATPVTTWRGPMILTPEGGFVTHTPEPKGTEW